MLSVGGVEGGETGVEPVEEGSLEEPLPKGVDDVLTLLDCRHGLDGENGISAVGDDVEDALDVSQGEQVVDGQADNRVGHARGIGQVLTGCAGQAAVGREVADERIEVAAGEDAVLAQQVVELVTRAAIALSVDKDGEVAVVVAHAWHIVPESDALDGTQRLAVADSNLAARADGLVDLLQVEQAIGRTDLVHLAVDAGGNNFGLTLEAEVLEVVDALLHLGIAHDERSALDGVEHLGCMETQRGHVALLEDALAVNLDAKGVGSVVDDAQAVLVGDVLDFAGAARLAIDVHRHDGRGARRDGGFDAVRVDASRGGVDVDKDRLDAVPPQRMGGCNETVGRGDDLARDVERLQRRDQRQSAVGEHADVGHLEVFAQGGLKALVEDAIVGNPLVVPHLLEQLVVLGEVGQKGRCHGDDVIIFHVHHTIYI